eukprot:Em0023g895a
MASRTIERVGQRAGVNVTWRPVLLGGLYENVKAPQGKDGSATDVMAPAKAALLHQDLIRQLQRCRAPFSQPSHHPQKTVHAMRLLAGISDNQTRASVSQALYKAYWADSKDVSDMSLLQEIGARFSVDAQQLISSPTSSATLRSNTKEAADRGAFGVPSFFVNDQLYYGADRLFLVERALGVRTAEPERLLHPPKDSNLSSHLSFYFDYSSPWSFLGCMKLQAMIDSVKPVNVVIEWVPILLGALFRQIGTPLVPMQAMSEAKVKYGTKDMKDWCDYAQVELQWPDVFPLRTVLPLRVTIASKCDPMLIMHLYKAAWQRKKDIGNEEVLRGVLQEEGFAAESLLAAANTDEIKQQLQASTQRAITAGLCGVPSFQVNHGPVVWGQDRMHVVADMLCGWECTLPSAKL